MAQRVDNNEPYIKQLQQIFQSESRQNGLDPIEYARQSLISTLNERKGFGYWHVRKY